MQMSDIGEVYYQYVYNTDNPIREPHKVVGLHKNCQVSFIAGINMGKSLIHSCFWNTLFNEYNITTTPVPFDGNGVLKHLMSYSLITLLQIVKYLLMNEDWEFGDG